MRIVIDLTSLSYHMTGIERYALCVTKKMLEIDKRNEYILLFRNSIYDSLEHYIDEKRVSAKILKGNNKPFFLQCVLAVNLYKIKADKYLFFAFTSPIIFRRKGIINTIHDMGAWDSAFSMTCLQRLYFRISYIISAKVAESIITVSQFSKSRICKLLNIPENKVIVINSAIPDSLFKDSELPFKKVKKKYNIKNEYIMSLSTLEPRKNLTLLLDAYTDIMDQLDYDLVLVGRKGWKMDEELKKYNAESRIIITGFVDDEEVIQIYKNTLCFVFPSLYEGFGLPPVEALSLGAPVLSSDAASMPEVLMNQAVYFKNNDLDELKKKLLNLKDMVNIMPRGLNAYQKDNFNFNMSAQKVLELISHIHY